MKLQIIGILAITILTLNSQAMEKPCTSIDDLRKDGTSFYSWLPRELHDELYKFATNNAAVKWALHKHAESVGFNAKSLKGHASRLPVLAINKVNNRLFAGSSDEVKILNVETGHCEQILQGHTGWITCLAVTNKCLFTGSNDRTIKIWNLKTEQCQKILHGHTEKVLCLAVANNKLISGSDDKTIKIWNPETGECVKTLVGHTTWGITCLTVANNKIISGSDDGMIKIWNLETLQYEKTFQGHTFTIKCLAVANNRIISGSSEGMIKIWDLEKGDCCYSLKGSSIFLKHIDVAAEYAYGTYGSDIIIILKLEDPIIKKALESSMDAANLIEFAYNCSQNKQALDLRKNAWLRATFTRLPLALQKVIQKEIMVQLPS